MAQKEEQTIVNLREKTKMTATAAHPYHKTGQEFEVHPVHVKKLTETGWAVEGHGVSKDLLNPQDAAGLAGPEVGKIVAE